jgi:hypothetical protein
MIFILNCFSSDAPLHEQLGFIPMSAWEDELPIFDVCVRETLRIYAIFAALR